MNITTRCSFIALFIFTLLLFGASLVLQYGFHLEPCSLCLIDRILVFILMLSFFVAALHNPGKRGKGVYCLIGCVVASLGVFVSGQHLWILLAHTGELASCTPSIDYLIETLPLSEVVVKLLQGSRECADEQQLFFGLSLPYLTLGAFILILMGSVFTAFLTGKKKGS